MSGRYLQARSRSCTSDLDYECRAFTSRLRLDPVSQTLAKYDLNWLSPITLSQKCTEKFEQVRSSRFKRSFISTVSFRPGFRSWSVYHRQLFTESVASYAKLLKPGYYVCWAFTIHAQVFRTRIL